MGSFQRHGHANDKTDGKADGRADGRAEGILCMLLCVLCWSTSGLFIKFIDWPPMVISGIRSGMAALFMLAVGGGKMFRGTPSRRDRKPGAALLLAAAGASAGTKILYVLANKLTSPANAIFLHHSAPIWAVFLAWFFIG
jgi:drug/metabolite transporter (DMT)-like permease